jgi:hypothetical protein
MIYGCLSRTETGFRGIEDVGTVQTQEGARRL